MTFTPDIPLHPWITLQQHIEYVWMTKKEFAKKSGIDKQTVDAILKWTTTVTYDIAKKLEHVTGISAQTWTNLEESYRNDEKRLWKNK
jgi:plasmid maintenance system antidote protein VapI